MTIWSYYASYKVANQVSPMYRDAITWQSHASQPVYRVQCAFIHNKIHMTIQFWECNFTHTHSLTRPGGIPRSMRWAGPPGRWWTSDGFSPPRSSLSRGSGGRTAGHSACRSGSAWRASAAAREGGKTGWETVTYPPNKTGKLNSTNVWPYK